MTAPAQSPRRPQVNSFCKLLRLVGAGFDLTQTRSGTTQAGQILCQTWRVDRANLPLAALGVSAAADDLCFSR